MAEAKTKQNDASVKAFIDKVDDPKKRADSHALVKLMEEVSGEKAKMWGPAIVGFGSYHYKYESGREGDAPLIGFSPRKANISLYLKCGLVKSELFEKLGKHKMGGGCLYIKDLADVDTKVLKTIMEYSLAEVKKLY